VSVVSNNAGESDLGILLRPVDFVKTVRVTFGESQKILHTASSNTGAGVHSHTNKRTARVVEDRAELELTVR
jgi:hypothetical protein